jgi:hypothetical protein
MAGADWRHLPSGTAAMPTVYAAYADEHPVISGGVRLADLTWRPTGDGSTFAAAVPADLATEEIFVNGERQILARYPNYDPEALRPKRFGAGANGEPDAPKFNGASADSTSPRRVASWRSPMSTSVIWSWAS